MIMKGKAEKELKIEDLKAKVLLTIPEARVLLRIDTKQVYKLVKSNLLPAMRIGSGRDLLIRNESIMNFLAKYDGYDCSDVNNIKQIDFYYDENSKVN